MQQNTPNPCSDNDQSILDLLRDIAKMQMGKGLDYDSAFMEKARKKAEERYEKAQEERRQLQQYLENIKSSPQIDGDQDPDDLTNANFNDFEQQLESLSGEQKGITKKDYDAILEDLEQQGLLDQESERPRLTSKGARIIGQGLLSRILLSLERKGLGPHKIEELGEGSWSGSTRRLYETGDLYHRIDIERTLLATAERGALLEQLSVRDFHVLESRHSTELHFGILVDQSASMRKQGKIEAANETALALAELMQFRYPEDKLRVFTFSEEVREVLPWMITASTVEMKFTDIRAALRAYRTSVVYLPGNKQVHLITDSAPNFLDGEFVGFNKAVEAVIQEARLYRVNGIVLNIIMLDKDENLRKLAQALAKENLGRVAYVDPENLGEVLVDDYISSKADLMRG
jgi:uncharacterized protein with von Willebrand factor type A (vWA) domain